MLNKTDKEYIAKLEGLLNQACTEIESHKSLFKQMDEKIQTLNANIEHLLGLIEGKEHEEKMPISLQEYLKSFNIKAPKTLIFGIFIPQKFIKNSSIPTLQYHLYQHSCFIQEKITLKGLVSKNKRDLNTIGQTLGKYIELSLKNQGKTEARGIVYMSTHDGDIIADYYGNTDIEQECEDFIKLYSQEESLENLLNKA